ncbi:hypothetical protein JMJ35_009003 [Cladonia borealis]|uniref:Uncharacterized protein n=1 Tax=Cladonia borealis TaxID=184061 RepID=A0AA39QT40_9LECA|nr:hypothetical protein JMJ35_009003 [Cladonia borealis]
MRPTTYNIACKHTLSLSSTVFRIRPSLRTSHLLSLDECHVSTTSNISVEETLRQIRAKQWYDHLYTNFHTINGHTSPTFKILLADMARRAGHTVNEGDDVAGSRCDWTGNNPMLKEKAELSARFAKFAGDSVNEDDDGVREPRRNWFEESEDEDGGAGVDGKATDDDEDVTENRLDRYLDAVEKDAKAVLEHVRVLKGEEVMTNDRCHRCPCPCWEL